MDKSNLPIKEPKQSRSRAVFESILEACHRLLPQYGAKTTTNKIAETAGVSIGSLYQYFPNKEAIFAKLIVQLQDKNAKDYLKLLEEQDKYEPEEFVELLVDQGMDVFLKNEELFRHLFRIGPKVVELKEIILMRQKVSHSLAKSFEGVYSDIEPETIHHVTMILVESFFGNLQAYLLSDQSIPKENLRVQLKRLAVGYMRHSLDIERRRLAGD